MHGSCVKLQAPLQLSYSSGDAAETPSCAAAGVATLAEGTQNACAIARAPAAALNDFPVAIADRALAGFPEQRPGRGDPLSGVDLRIRHETVYSELVDIPVDLPVDTRMRLGFEREPGRFASIVTVTLTPCSKDLRPSVGPQETLTRDACRYVGPPYGAPGGPLPSLRVAFDPAAPAEYCVLQPGETYFLNYTFRDMREPVDPLNSTCESSDGQCSLIFEWDDEPS